ncbi:hypothetical protein AKJ62_01345 [candidate division MSBL1 archaeon SCGC-AAA259D14]|uniref:Phosphoesterase HXTX domain-containing protein n=1 Tax=candidate division MSBL1 archaeon SCGC-AAA259D14 TaxID=1698261 RepID=A0A133U7P8_9EURY|nr:hypothetical protein AKJ62_01345 [candidate division MSBL1 archaeon SCGC-AAA259D14]
MGERCPCFLALKVELPEEIKQSLDKLEEGYVPYDGSAGEHKIPHVTVVPPREDLSIEDWKKEIGKTEDIPAEFEVTGFGSFWESSKFGFWGNLDADIGVGSPHLTLLDCGEKEGVDEARENLGSLFEKYVGLKIDVVSLAVVKKNEGVVYEVKSPSHQAQLKEFAEDEQ